MATDSLQQLERGDFVRYCYRLGHGKATGILSLELEYGTSELLVLRRGQIFTRDVSGRTTRLRLERFSSSHYLLAQFDSGLAAYPPAVGRPFDLAHWARQHLEAQLDSVRAQDLVRQLAGVRLQTCDTWLPDSLDATDRRIVDCMKEPRRLDQIWPAARAPRFRLLCFVHFLRSVGALRESGVAASHHISEKQAAMKTLGLSPSHQGPPSAQTIKDAYRRLARKHHPDLQTGMAPNQKRKSEQELALINGAYRELQIPSRT